MKIEDIRQKTDQELQEEVIKFKKEGMNLRFQKASGEISNFARLREVRRIVARINTILGERKKA